MAPAGAQINRFGLLSSTGRPSFNPDRRQLVVDALNQFWRKRRELELRRERLPLVGGPAQELQELLAGRSAGLIDVENCPDRAADRVGALPRRVRQRKAQVIRNRA